MLFNVPVVIEFQRMDLMLLKDIKIAGETIYINLYLTYKI